MRPPMSATWQVLAKRATHFPFRKTGVRMVMSLIWPAVIQGSFVSRTSPGDRLSGGYTFRKCRTPVAMALMWPGVPVSDCATMLPLTSKTPQARSWDSRTMVLNAVRIRAACCSLHTESRRFQSTSRVIGSMVDMVAVCEILISIPSAQVHPEVAELVDGAAATRADDDGRFALLDDGRPDERRARRQ